MTKRINRLAKQTSPGELRDRSQASGLEDTKFQSLLEAAPSAIVVVNSDGWILAINQQTEKLFGYKRDELLAMNAEALIAERFRENHPGRRAGFFADPQLGIISQELQLYGVRQNGSEFPTEIRLSPLKTEEGLVAISAIRDITERKRAEDELRALHEIDVALTSTFDLQVILGVLLEKTDLFLPSPSATMIRLLNEKSGRLEPVVCRGVDEEKWRARGITVLGIRAQELLHGLTPYTTIINLRTDPRVVDHDFYREEGLISHLGVRLTANEKPLGVVGFYTKREHQFSKEEISFLSSFADRVALAIYNASLYKEMEKLAGELALANKVKDEFMSVMSHELRTPLTALIGYAQLLCDGALGMINERQNKALQKMLNRSKDLMNLIDNILMATRIEAEAVQQIRDFVELKDFLQKLELEYMDLLENDLILNWDYPPELPAIQTDSRKLKQILENLIGNAIKFTGKGKVTVQVRQIAGKAVEFKVIDTGVGIPQDALSLIFERFRQVDSSNTRPHSGAGIGLFVVKKFTELLGGTVQVESEMGKGSTFTVRLPY